jgi:hypothetical protein|tara:strand:+ start:169 stop:351 length:183 start_codon:yes stop_codon:yes gene_type:complete
VFENNVSYDYTPSILPSIKILCRDENGKEEIDVLEDATGMCLEDVVTLCEEKAMEWIRNR